MTSTPPSITIIDSNKKLATLRTELKKVEILAFDTEFHAENRYLPKLMLIQLADFNNNIWLLDPLKIDLPLISDALSTKKFITHGGQEDIRLLNAHLSIVPHKIFDTQIAAAFLGVHYPARLSLLLEKHLNEKNSKKETLSDWSKRPLDPQQIEYAAQDAFSLVQLYKYYKNLLLEKEAWVWEASKEMQKEALKPPIYEWLSWKVVQQFDSKSKNTITELMRWRQETAHKKNKPLNYILPRNIIVDLTRRKPTSIPEIKLNRRINHGLIKNHGHEILQCISKGLRSKRIWPTIEYTHLAKEKMILAWAVSFAETCGISPDLLMPASLAQNISINGIEQLVGWRKKMFKTELQDFLDAKTTIGFQDTKPTIYKK